MLADASHIPGALPMKRFCSFRRRECSGTMSFCKIPLPFGQVSTAERGRASSIALSTARETPSLRRGPDHSTRTQLECERLLQHRFRKRHLQYTNRVGKRGLPLVEPFLKGVKTSSGTTREFRLRRSSPKAHAGTRDGYLLKRCPPENTRFLKRANRFES